jgi:putative phage-type endonuclease
MGVVCQDCRRDVTAEYSEPYVEKSKLSLEISGLPSRLVNALLVEGYEHATNFHDIIQPAKTSPAAIRALKKIDGVGDKSAAEILSWYIDVTGYAPQDPPEPEPPFRLPDDDWRLRAVRNPPEAVVGVVGNYEHDTQEWHYARSQGIGSSDAGAILGLSPHATSVDVWRSKVDAPELARPWLDLYSEFGRWFEPYIHFWACQQTDRDLMTHLGTLCWKPWPVMRANLDAWDAIDKIPEEYKTTSEKWDSIPEAYFAQCQHQMLVSNSKEVRLRQFVCPLSRELIPPLLKKVRPLAMMDVEAERAIADWLLQEGEIVTWIVERDDDFIEGLVERAIDFWGYVERNEEPPVYDPHGTVDLSEVPELSGLFDQFAQLKEVVDAGKPDAKAADAVKKDLRREIERQLALLGEKPKRLKVGEHKATLIQKEGRDPYWGLYPGGVDVAI